MRLPCLILLSLFAVGSFTANAYSWEEDLHRRLLLDFDKTRSEVKTYIQRFIPDVTDEQIDVWEKSHALESMVIDGQKRYFHHAAPNLFRIDKNCIRIKAEKEGLPQEGYEEKDKTNVPLIIQNVDKATRMAEPKRIRITYTLTVKPDAVPEGELIRCWLPFPRTDIARQTDVKLLSTSEQQYQRSPQEHAHSTLYMEKRAKAGVPTIFSETFEYSTYGYWAGLTPEQIKPYNIHSQLYKQYTSERDRHMVFTPVLRHLADSLTRGENNPLLKARRIFAYIDANYPWASAREYSTIENIPEYVVLNKHGDCGQVTLLFATLCRISGIPSHFQSGFMLHPDNENLHDWCEIYFEGVGWIPVDMSFGIPSYARNEQEKWFFLGGIDSWRMVVNQDFGMPLYPAKTYPRSETVDFQRGEVEWRGGNLYFDQWSWNLERRDI
uniref:Transglutaminase domain-containing protein n=1 Tax=Prevotella sp. GTC17253 TaxID=3236793 RepID=A0AB33ISD8_9BACT